MAVVLGKNILHGVQGMLWCIVVFTQMAEPGVFEMMAVPEDGFSSASIGEMTIIAGNAHFEWIGIGTVHQHVIVVIGFDDKVFRAFDMLQDGIGDMAYVGDVAEADILPSNEIAYVSLAVMGYMKRFERASAACFDGIGCQESAEFAGYFVSDDGIAVYAVPHFFCSINRQGVFLGQ